MRVLDAIQGHTSRNASEDYGDVTVKAKANAIAKFPDIKVSALDDRSDLVLLKSSRA